MRAWLNANEIPGINEIPTDDEEEASGDENDSANESMDEDDHQDFIENEQAPVEENVAVAIPDAEAGPVEPDFENFDDAKIDE